MNIMNLCDYLLIQRTHEVPALLFLRSQVPGRALLRIPRFSMFCRQVARGFFRGFTELGLLSFASGDFEEAAKLFEAAVVGDPEAGPALPPAPAKDRWLKMLKTSTR